MSGAADETISVDLPLAAVTELFLRRGGSHYVFPLPKGKDSRQFSEVTVYARQTGEVEDPETMELQFTYKHNGRVIKESTLPVWVLFDVMPRMVSQHHRLNNLAFNEGAKWAERELLAKMCDPWFARQGGAQ